MRTQGKLYAAESDDQAKDMQLLTTYRRYADFIQARHLEISETLVQEGWVQVAIARISHLELRKIADYSSPRDKLVCVSNCYRVVSSKARQRSSRLQALHQVRM
jgi:hypothetical protein